MQTFDSFFAGGVLDSLNEMVANDEMGFDIRIYVNLEAS
jgi:hypothetical protein